MRILRTTENTQRYSRQLDKIFTIKDDRVRKLLSRLDPVEKKVIQRKIFIDQITHGISISTYKGISPLLLKDYQRISGVKNHDAIKFSPRRTPIVSSNISSFIISVNNGPMINVYEELIQKNSVVFLINDQSDTVTDIDFENKIMDEIRHLNTRLNPLTHFNVIPSLFAKSIKSDENISKNIEKLYESDDKNNLLKIVAIPYHSIDQIVEIFEIFEPNEKKYPIISLYINLDQSPKISRGIVEMMTSKNSIKFTEDTPLNYESLLQIARESHSDTNSLTKNFLTKIGQGNLTDVNVTKGSISFTRENSTR